MSRSVTQLLSSKQEPSGKELIDSGAFQNLKLKKIPFVRGLGVYTMAHFRKGQVLVRYAGETISFAEGERREELRKTGASLGIPLYIKALFAVCQL